MSTALITDTPAAAVSTPAPATEAAPAVREVPAAAAVGAAPATRPHVSTRPAFVAFRHLLLAVLALNAAAAVVLLATAPSWATALTATITAASVDIGIAALVRQQYFVNLVFAAATSAPTRWPLRVRVALARVYQVTAGVHVGCAIAAVLWFSAFTALVGEHVLTGSGDGLWIAVLAVAGAIVADLVVMAVCARPQMRERHHDTFEATHRYGGWLSLVLFAVLTVLVAATRPAAVIDSVLVSPNTWILATVAVFALIPWLQLRRVPVDVVTPSSHVALVSIDRGIRIRTGSASRIARRPLGEWHAFANMTAREGTGYRLAVSRAGDWTSRFIDDRPDHVWVRGVPTTGVGTVARLFTKVVWVATGSGIAPCLPHLLNDETPAQLVWVTRNPERTYGRELVGEIFAAQPDAVLWDTDAQGKPDLADLAYRTAMAAGAEAVIVISNKRTTLRVVSQLHQRGVAAFGPIWDS
ncbi:hypothetical protein [Nakamurella endophytica]|uniref:Uncharacterized protein n=1 Tax=Nakamurella endophytica TaxID=1748367 RepID=A0A917WDX0_9ACTN|nr:hypothetical protein [Nakamurella endophytica]GGL96443.1 hypothetical protein GCM10011594_15250 [Nakamurella endophytica]